MKAISPIRFLEKPAHREKNRVLDEKLMSDRLDRTYTDAASAHDTLATLPMRWFRGIAFQQGKVVQIGMVLLCLLRQLGGSDLGADSADATFSILPIEKQ